MKPADSTIRESGNDGGVAPDCKSGTLETSGVRIPPFPPLNSYKNSKKQGDAGLGVAIGWFTGQGYTTLIPLTDSQDYDLVVDMEGKLCKIQVKTTTCIVKGHYYVGISVKGGNRSGLSKLKKFDNSESDYLFIVTGAGVRYLIPTAGITAKHTISLTMSYDKYKV